MREISSCYRNLSLLDAESAEDAAAAGTLIWDGDVTDAQGK